MPTSYDDFAIGKKACRTTSMAATVSVSQVPVLASAEAEILIEPFDLREPVRLTINWTVPCQDGSR